MNRLFGIPASQILYSTTPYRVESLYSKFNKDNTVLVYASTEKDPRLSPGKYFRGALPKDPKPYSQQAYTIPVPYMSNKFEGEEISGTTVRNLFSSSMLSSQQKRKAFKLIFGKYDESVFKLFMNKLGGNLNQELLGIKDSKGNRVLLTCGGASELIREDGYVKCQICGNYYKQIVQKHLDLHNVSIADYKGLYPLISEKFKNTMENGKNSMVNQNVRKKHKESVNTLEYKEIQKLGSTGRAFTEQSKLKMSINNPMNDAENRKKVSQGVKNSYTEELRQNRRKSSKIMMENNKQRIATIMRNKGLWKDPSLRSAFQEYSLQCWKQTNLSLERYSMQIPLLEKRSRNWHLDHKYSIASGFKHNIDPSLIGHYKNLQIIPGSDNCKKFIKNSITLQQLLLNIKNSKNNKCLLTCGGASGHLNHIFQDTQLTFNDFRSIINNLLSGKINVESQATMKYDGQNINVSWKNGKLVAARNKGHQKNFGETAPDVLGIKNMFAGRGAIQKAFTFAMIDLQRAFSAMPKSQLDQIFGQGKRWLALEIIYSPTANVIPYDKSMLVFHNLTEVDQAGNKVKVDGSMAKSIYSIILSVNANVQKHFAIHPPTVVRLPKISNFAARKGYYLAKLNTLQQRFKLSGKSTLQDYNDAFWQNLIQMKASSFKYDVPKPLMEALITRWSKMDKTASIAVLKRLCPHKEFLNWILAFDKNDHQAVNKKNAYDWQILFMELTSQVLKNLGQYMVVNPENAVKKVSAELLATAEEIKNSNNLALIDKATALMNRINALGGIKAIVPTQGIVFTYKGNIYKATGLFSDINQILGAFKYAR